jgi:spore germination protein GerM
MKLHSYKSLQDEVFWSSALLLFAAAVVFGWLGMVLHTLSLPRSFNSLQREPQETLTKSIPVPAVVPAPVTVPTPVTVQSPATKFQSPLPAQAQAIAEVYWLQVNHNNIELQPQKLTFAPNTAPIDRLRGAIKLLLSTQSQPTNLGSTIPAQTRLLSLTQKGNAIYVDLSAEFAQGGGSSSMIYRVAQILYTATSIVPDAQVYLSIEGQMLDDAHPLGGEGLLLPSPLTRQQFAAEFNLS